MSLATSEEAILAAEDHAASYKGDPRACIEADVINAFNAGIIWAEKQLEDRVGILTYGLELVAGRKQCINPLLSNQEIAIQTLDNTSTSSSTAEPSGTWTDSKTFEELPTWQSIATEFAMSKYISMADRNEALIKEIASLRSRLIELTKERNVLRSAVSHEADVADSYKEQVLLAKDTIKQLRDVLGVAKEGINWYIREVPNLASESDNEMLSAIDSVLSLSKDVPTVYPSNSYGKLQTISLAMSEALKEIAWSNDSLWQRDRAKAALLLLQATLVEQASEKEKNG